MEKVNASKKWILRVIERHKLKFEALGKENFFYGWDDNDNAYLCMENPYRYGPKQFIEDMFINYNGKAYAKKFAQETGLESKKISRKIS